MCEHGYCILLHMQILYQGSPYMLSDNFEKSQQDLEFLRHIYSFLADKFEYQSLIKRTALHALYLHTEEAIHRFYGTESEMIRNRPPPTTRYFS